MVDYPHMTIMLFKMLYYSFYLHPRMAEDLIATHSVFSHALVSVSIGKWAGTGRDFFEGAWAGLSCSLLFTLEAHAIVTIHSEAT